MPTVGLRQCDEDFRVCAGIVVRGEAAAVGVVQSAHLVESLVRVDAPGDRAGSGVKCRARSGRR